MATIRDPANHYIFEVHDYLDNVQAEARCVIGDGDETFGLLLYATPEALTRDFINRIELHEAIRRKEKDNTFLLLAIARRMSFGQLAEITLEKL